MKTALFNDFIELLNGKLSQHLNVLSFEVSAFRLLLKKQLSRLLFTNESFVVRTRFGSLTQRHDDDFGSRTNSRR